MTCKKNAECTVFPKRFGRDTFLTGTCTGTRMKWPPWRTVAATGEISLPSIDTAFLQMDRCNGGGVHSLTHTPAPAPLPWPLPQEAPAAAVITALSEGPHLGPCFHGETSIIIRSGPHSPPPTSLVRSSIKWRWCIKKGNTSTDCLPSWSPLGECNSADPTMPHSGGPWVYTWEAMYWGVWFWLQVKLEFPINWQ